MEPLYMERLHRITQRLIDKHKDTAWVDVWHLADNTFDVSLYSSKKYFKCYWCDWRQLKVLGFRQDLTIEEAAEICCVLHQMGLPIDRFSMHGSMIYDSEKLREMIKENAK